MKKIPTLFLLLTLVHFLQAQRNVILIIADDLGTDYLGFYEDHQDTAAVPNIRKLLNKGVRFTNAMSNPVCSATRAGMLTGRYSFRTGVGGIVGGEGGSSTLNINELTIPRLLNIYKPNGISKANIGKWHLHLGMPMSNLNNPNTMGYDIFKGNFIGQLTSFYNWTKVTNGVAGNVTTYATTETVNDAIAFTSANTSKPFFLWLAFNAPHAPYHLPPAGLHSYTNLSGTQQDIMMNPKSYFKASLEALDHEIGRLFDALEANNQLDSTEFIFMGDNGNTIQTAQIANTDKAKGTVYQYGVHVPFIISGPSVINPGRKSDALVNTADVFATILELFGYTGWSSQISVNKPVDSKSILPILKDQSTAIRPWSFTEIFKLMPDSADGKAIRNMTYKLIHFDNGREEFYNLVSDPGEVNNLLPGALSPDAQSNYIYLCNEMSNLVGTGSFCSAAVDTKEETETRINYQVFPNPFRMHLNIKSPSGREFFELLNAVGEIIFSGQHLENQNFSGLPKGVYFLKITDQITIVTKVIKQ